MKLHLIIYAVLILIFIGFNFFVEIPDSRLSTAVNLLLGSVLFGYISWIAIVILRRMKK